VWQAASGHELYTLKGHARGIRSVAFSPDGRRIVTGSDDNTAKVWEAGGGQELLTLKGHTAPITCVSCSPDGQRIATGSGDRTATVWLAAAAEQVAAWQAEERTGAQNVALLQRDATAEQQRQQIAREGYEGSIKRWLILAPISLSGQGPLAGLDSEQVEGEGHLRPKAGDVKFLVSNRGLRWQESVSGDYVIDFNMFLERVTPWSVAYAVCYVWSEAEQRGLRMLVGSSDEAKVYLNGEQVYKYQFPRSFVADQDMAPDITLNPGRNVLVFKVVNEVRDWKGSIRLTDAQGNPVKGIRVTIDPDAKD
jgi:hypothetical protein